MNLRTLFRTVDIGFDGSVRYCFHQKLRNRFFLHTQGAGVNFLNPISLLPNNPQGTATDLGTTTPVYEKDNSISFLAFQMGIYCFLKKIVG